MLWPTEELTPTFARCIAESMAAQNESVMKMRDPRVEIIAHRGSSFLAPENTLAALRLGWEETTTCELDIRPTADGRLAVIHDDSTRRTTGVDLQVAAHTLDELQRLDAGTFKGVPFAGEKVPSLEEAIAAMPAGKRLFIEIKAGPEIIPELTRVVRASGKETQLLLHSFSHPVCIEAKQALPQVPVYLLIASRQNSPAGAWLPSLDEAVLNIKESGLDGMGANNSPLVDAASVQRVHSHGLKLNVYTIDQVDQARRLIALGIDGLITNRPGWLKDQLMELA